MNDLLTLIAAIIAATGASFVTGILTRPKTRADATASRANAEVTMSSEAREWTRMWVDAATRAQLKADHAELRCDILEEHVALMITHIREQDALIRALQGKPLPFPELPPLPQAPPAPNL